jgi:hypothetical protein
VTYTAFLRQAAEFSPRIFADRLYAQYGRYRETGDLQADPAFQDWAASLLAQVVAGAREA